MILTRACRDEKVRTEQTGAGGIGTVGVCEAAGVGTRKTSRCACPGAAATGRGGRHVVRVPLESAARARAGSSSANAIVLVG
jgi:hypothetical protein